MTNRFLFGIRQTLLVLTVVLLLGTSAYAQLAALTERQEIHGFRVSNLYSDANGEVIGAKFIHVGTASPVFVLNMQTVPKAFIWIETPDRSDRGVPHALEHLLSGKGTKGRYVTLLTDMRLGESAAGTRRDFNFYSFSSGTGMQDFIAEFRAWLDALFRADFTDAEAERELYHFGIGVDADKNKTLIEAGSVYDEVQGGQSQSVYYFELNKHLLGEANPFGFDIRGLPDPMRVATAADIRRFYRQNYQLGPTTGFLFIIDPKENLSEFLTNIGTGLDAFAEPNSRAEADYNAVGAPKYGIVPSSSASIEIYPFPSGRDTDAGTVRLGWKPVKIASSSDLKLLEMLFRGLAADQNSLLYKALVDRRSREYDSGATKVDNDVLIQNSPFFPFEQIEISGIPGDRITPENIERLRGIVLSKIREIADYSDHSTELRAFNAAVRSQLNGAHRSERIWARTPPLFGSDLSTDWKDHLEALELDPAFVKSLSEEPAWRSAEDELKSDTNIWRDLISRFHLLDTPSATAAKPSSEMLANIDKGKQQRIRREIDSLRQQYHVDDDQKALALFEQQEAAKTRDIDAIQGNVLRPRFTEHPPLTADDTIQYRQFKLAGVPVIASLFERPPTFDVGLAFDLRQIPRKYYKYLPILPKCFDSVGLRVDGRLISYTELLAKIQDTTVSFSVGYEENAFSERTDLVFRTSVANVPEFNGALDLVNKILHSSTCDMSAADRLRDLVAQRLAVDYAFRHDEFRVMQNAAYSFFTQQNPLFQAAYATFPRTHWDERLQWKLHTQVKPGDIDGLMTFAAKIYSKRNTVWSEEIARQLARSDLSMLEKELLQYWQRSLSSFPPDDLPRALQQLTSEVKQDIAMGPAKTIAEIRELQRIVVNRGLLHIDLVTDEMNADSINKQILRFISSIPVLRRDRNVPAKAQSSFPIMRKVATRYGASTPGFPWYAGLVNPESLNGDMVFYASLPGYSALNRSSLIKILATKIFAGYGPESFFIKTREAGLAYAILLTSDPAFELLWLYADRSPDLPALIRLLNSAAGNVARLHDPLIVDYALRQTFAIPRSIYPPSIRGTAMAQDLRDGNDPGRVRRFSEAILSLRHEPTLFSELTNAVVPSVCGILLEDACRPQHEASRTIFFFVGSEQILSNAEKQLSAPRILRVFPSDYWME